MLASYEDIVKAQGLFHKMVGACGPKCFRKIVTKAIAEHSISDFYPIVVQAELSAALALSANAKARDQRLDLYEYLGRSFGIRPRNLVRLDTRPLADIMEKDARDVEEMLRELNFTVKNGIVTDHPDACRCASHTASPKIRVKIVKECA